MSVDKGSVGLVREAFARIDDAAGQGAKSFIRLFRERAAAEAQAIDLLRKAGAPLGPLGGIPVSVKDLCDVAGSTTTAGSVALKDRPPAQHDAPVVARLRAAGAVIVGTNNMTEFAMGGVGINPHYGTPLNPWDRKTGRIPGGSSSGGAVAVADGIVRAALGSDTAGSIQMPAALCGITGLKPTARRVPLEATIPLSFTLDSIGPLARSVADCAAMDAVLAGERPAVLEPVDIARMRFGVPQTLVLDDLEPPVASAFQRALSVLSKAGARIEDVRFSELAELPAINAKGGFSVAEGYAWHRRLLETHRHLYDPIVAGRFEVGKTVSAAEYIDMLNARADLITRCARLTREFDAILMPTVPIIAPPLADLERKEAPWLAANRRLIRNPIVANFLDRCAVSLPCHEAGGAPVGLSIMGETLGDRRILAIALGVEKLLTRP